MVKDYSGIPCDIKITNTTDDEIVVRLNNRIDEAIAKGDILEIEVATSAELAEITYNMNEIGATVEKIVPPTPPPTSLPTVEVGKKYEITLKNNIPSLEDFDEYGRVCEELEKTYIAVSENTGICGVGIMPTTPTTTEGVHATYVPLVVSGHPSGWTTDEGVTLATIQNPYTITIGLIKNVGEEANSLDLNKLSFMIESAIEVND